MNIAIIGAGNVGLAIAQALLIAGHDISLVSRNQHAFKKKMQERNLALPTGLTLCEEQSAFENADLILLAVPDTAIESVCLTISPRLRPNSTIAHFSGALDSSVLNSAKELGLFCCSLHPLNTFPNLESSLTALSAGHASYLFCEGHQQALDVSGPLFEQCGFQVVRITAAAKPLYHAASVFACNYLSVLMEASLNTGSAAELDKHLLWQALQPLIQTTLNNIDNNGPAESLSGPIARGDVSTIDKHRTALEQAAPELATLYTELGKQAVRIVEKRDSLDPETIQQLWHSLR